MNQVVIIGRLGDDAELRYTQSKKPVCSWNVASSYKYTKDGEEKETTEWHNVTIWGKPGESAARAVKGDLVVVIGRKQTRSYENRDGVKVKTTDIVAETVARAFTPQKNETQAPKRNGPQERGPDQRIVEDDLPF